MRLPAFIAVIALTAPLTCAAEGIADATASAAPASRPALMFVNAQVSPRSVALNQPVRIEFTTRSRQIDSVDIASAVSGGIALAGAQQWRLVGKPLVSESDKTRSITVTLSLLPRATGELPLPTFALTWLVGSPRPELGSVTVANGIVVGGEVHDLPGEYNGVAGIPWGTRLDELAGKRIPGESLKSKDGRTVATLGSGLELGFRNGELGEASARSPGLTLDQARVSFTGRWGLPLYEENGTLTWVIGWTRITASGDGAGGVRVDLQREDTEARQAAGIVRSRVFDLLEGTAKP